MDNKDKLTEYSAISTERVGKILVITLNREKSLNAVNNKMTYELDHCLQAAERDPTILVIILTGSGRAFCAGADLKELASAGKPFEKPKSGFAGIVQANLSKPIIAAVNGLAYGGGFEIALSCDLIVASDSAKFALPEVKRGIIAAAGGLLRLPRQLPLKVAMMMILTGEEETAFELEKWGVVNTVVKKEELLPTALSIAEKITNNAPLAIKASKKVVLEGLDLPLHSSDEAWELSAKATSEVLASEDSKEGPKAFAEKRSPEWRGY